MCSAYNRSLKVTSEGFLSLAEWSFTKLKELILVNDALNKNYLRLYVIGHMVSSDSERRNPLPPRGLLFLISSKVFFYMRHRSDRIAHTTAFVTPVVEHWLEREIAQWVHPIKDRSDDRAVAPTDAI